ncbi:hypothetical protein [Heyndrickxia oleronia]|uniref:Uncharacterized protein n=1 Tax=Heyndrickxia oleronia TaxID=38875 RepID=A0AAW6SRG8_9BACI|nr:hypothetical protein [Heyndrickxia oleronia]MDH5159840.1 hypothetical protein [Heyndrickxia oleronia]
MNINERIDELWTQTKRNKLPREQRFKAIEALTDEYIAVTGKRPEPAALDRLATLCLYEEVTDSDRMKSRNNEHPILSDDQYARRTEGKYNGNGVEVSIGAASNHGVDGNNHAKPTRNIR